MFESFSAENTFDIGRNIASKCKPKQIYCLNGELGTGKTIFSKGFAKGLCINENVSSPTFTLINEYIGGTIPLYHFDIYRINNISEMEETGYEDYFYGNGVCLVEWANLILDLIPNEAIFISIEKDLSKGDDYRIIKVD
jgi:tRNA threonylcarbamoyladenosine biosynthesis protein TsaE